MWVRPLPVLDEEEVAKLIGAITFSTSHCSGRFEIELFSGLGLFSHLAMLNHPWII